MAENLANHLSAAIGRKTDLFALPEDETHLVPLKETIKDSSWFRVDLPSMASTPKGFASRRRGPRSLAFNVCLLSSLARRLVTQQLCAEAKASRVGG